MPGMVKWGPKIVAYVLTQNVFTSSCLQFNCAALQSPGPSEQGGRGQILAEIKANPSTRKDVLHISACPPTPFHICRPSYGPVGMWES